MTSRELLALGSKPDISVGERVWLISTTMVFRIFSWLPAMFTQREVERTLPQYPNKTPRAVFRNLGDGIFEELHGGSRPGGGGASLQPGGVDFDNDGDIDVLIINLNEPPSLLRNDLRGTTNWIKVKLESTKFQPECHRSQSSSPLWE